jgi:uncharacterized protein YidB (DUF937 family)
VTDDDHEPIPSDDRPRRIPVWVIPLMIGIVAVTAGVFTWRAGQLGSAAAFEDRQAVGQTIKQQQVEVEARLGAIEAAVGYVRYRADYAEAAALDDLADQLSAQGIDALASSLEADASRLRISASELAVAAGVFGRQSFLNQVVTSSDVPVPFEFQEKVRQLETQLTTGIGSPGALDPDEWADRADDTRSRVRALRIAAMLLLTAAVAFTVAQLTARRPTRWAGTAVGSALFLVVSAATVMTVF